MKLRRRQILSLAAAAFCLASLSFALQPTGLLPGQAGDRVKVMGDHDVFGDGSLTLVSTPGHTPGHQSLLVRLPKTGAVLLSGDAVHFKDNWDNRRLPSLNFDKDKTAASMQRMADMMAKEKAQMWINHDKTQSDSLKMAPGFYD